MNNLIINTAIIMCIGGSIYGGIRLYYYYKANDHAVILANGKRGFAVRCVADFPMCYEAASNVCPNGYTVINNTDDCFTGQCK